MTAVRVCREGKRLWLSARGHAEGSPEICGAVSVLLQTLADSAVASGALLYVCLRDGLGELCVCRGQEKEFELTCRALRLLSEDYGDYVSYSER